MSSSDNLPLQVLDDPLRQIGAQRERQAVDSHRLAFGEPFRFAGLQYRGEIARAAAAETREPQQRGMPQVGACREMIEQQLAAQDAEHRFGHERAVVLADLAMAAEIMAEDRIGRMTEGEDFAQRIERGIELGVRDHCFG